LPALVFEVLRNQVFCNTETAQLLFDSEMKQFLIQQFRQYPDEIQALMTEIARGYQAQRNPEEVSEWARLLEPLSESADNLRL